MMTDSRWPVVASLALAFAGCPSQPESAPAEASATAEGSSEVVVAVAPALRPAMGGGRPGDGEAATADEPPAPPAARTRVPSSAHQPCTARVETADGAENECFEVPHVRVAGIPQVFCLGREEPYAWAYDDQGRVLNDGWRTFSYADDGSASVEGMSDEPVRATFDRKGRVFTLGAVTYRYDLAGRRLRIEEAGEFVSYQYAVDGTYTTEHNYPDTAEFCVADRTVVEGPPSRPTRERYEHCEQNEIPRTMYYDWDDHGRVTMVRVDGFHDGSVEARIHVHYDCHGGVDRR